MTKDDKKIEKKELIKNLEETLVWVKEAEELQMKVMSAYKVPYPVSFKINVAAAILLYMLYANSGMIGGILLLIWFGWQIVVNVGYHMFRLRGRMPEIVRWKDSANLSLERLEQNSHVPKEYWYSAAIEYFLKALKSGEANTMEDCIQLVKQ